MLRAAAGRRHAPTLISTLTLTPTLTLALALAPPPPPHPKPKPSPSSSPSPHPNQVAAKLATTPATIERCVQSTLAAAQARATATY